MNRRRFLLGLAASAVGCKGKSRSDDVSGPSPTGGGTPPYTGLLGYGLSDAWDDNDFEAQAELYGDHGLTLTGIEHVSAWFADPIHQGRRVILGEHVANPRRTAAYVHAMRRRGITTLLSVVNANNLRLVELPDEWFVEQLDGLLAEVGPAGVIMLGVSEPGNRGGDLDKQRRWQRYVLERWPGPTATTPGFPASVSGGTYRDVHAHSEPSGALGGNEIANTDGPWDPDPISAERYARKVVAARGHFLVYDTREPAAPDEAVVAALGRALGRG